MFIGVQLVNVSHKFSLTSKKIKIGRHTCFLWKRVPSFKQFLQGIKGDFFCIGEGCIYLLQPFCQPQFLNERKSKTKTKTKECASVICHGLHWMSDNSPQTTPPISGQSPSPISGQFAPEEENDKTTAYKIVFCQFDRNRGRIVWGANCPHTTPLTVKFLFLKNTGQENALTSFPLKSRFKLCEPVWVLVSLASQHPVNARYPGVVVILSHRCYSSVSLFALHIENSPHVSWVPFARKGKKERQSSYCMTKLKQRLLKT